MAKEKKSTVKSAPDPIETEESLENSPENTETPEGAVDDTAPEGEPGEEAEESEENKKLIASRMILYRGRLYNPGEELPADDNEMVASWLLYKSAKWVPDKPVAEQPKATQKTAQAGRTGIVSGGEKDIDGNDLVGKVPKTAQRSK